MEPLLCFDGVSKSYWRGHHRLPILSETSFQLAAGEIVAVWGMRSQGKTTLLKLACGMEHPDDGVIRFQGADLACLSEPRLSRLLGEHVGWISRSGPQLDITMLDYVALPLLVGESKRHAVDSAMEALERFGAAPCAGQHWDSLSDWERVLVSIAHAVVRTPKLLLVDDLVSNLGIREVDDLTRLLTAVAREAGVAVLMTVSDMCATLRSDRTMTLGGGRLSEAPGTRDERTNVIDFPGTERSA